MDENSVKGAVRQAMGTGYRVQGARFWGKVESFGAAGRYLMDTCLFCLNLITIPTTQNLVPST